MSTNGRKRGRPPKAYVQPSSSVSNFLKKPKSTLLFVKNSSRSSTPSKDSTKRCSSPSVRGSGRRRGRGLASNASASSSFHSWNLELESEKSAEGSLLPTSEDDGWSRSSEDDVVEESDTDDEVESVTSAMSSGLPTPSKTRGLILREEEKEVKEPPPLNLPPSSDDLLIPRAHVMSAMSVYEILRHFRSIIRLSPFRFEDFCMALQSQEQSVLLSEIHMSLLRCLIREEDKSNTHFGPQDIKDGLNTMLFFMDHLTWPQVLKQLFLSDREFASGMQALMENEYPFTSLENRLKVLVLLTDALLTTNVVRDDIISEGAIRYDDHCRVCHRVGDLLCCETCNATFHLACLDPPLEGIPTEDWICSVCEANLTPGVTDCISDAEKGGFIYRQECLGTDRHFRKYYFIVRRIVVHGEEEDEVWYYSSKPQLDELMDSLDRNEWEADLIEALEEHRQIIENQMSTTETLSREKGGSRKSYLECQNEKLLTLQRERAEKRAKEEREKREAEIQKKIDDDDDDGDDTKKPEGTDADADNLVVEDGTVEMDSSNTAVLKTDDDANRETNGGVSMAQSAENEDGHKDEAGSIAHSSDLHRKPRILETTAGEANLFKLGMENSFKNWVNQYSVNSLALNKSQHQEDRDRKRHMSHKFSLTPLSDFKWNGAVVGMKQMMIQTLRTTLSSLEGAIPQFLLHPVWPMQRNNWRRAVMMSNGFREFALALGILESVVKPVLFNEVWHASLGHPPHLKRVTQAERDEKKKQEKKDKKEEEGKEQEIDRSKMVKYSLGLKHNVWKQKGEEYRVAGSGGWFWCSATRCKRQLSGKAKSLLAQGKACVASTQGPIKNESPQIDVSGELIKNGLGLYSRVARRAKLDDLLFKRERLQATEANQLKHVEAKVAAVWPQGGNDRLFLDFCACLSTTIQVGEAEEGGKDDGGAAKEDEDGAVTNGDDEVMEDDEEERAASPDSDGAEIGAAADGKDEEEEKTRACYSFLCRSTSKAPSRKCYSACCPRRRPKRRPSEAERLFNKLGNANQRKKQASNEGDIKVEDVKPEFVVKDEKTESTVLTRLPTHLVTTKLHHHGAVLNETIATAIDKSVAAAKASDAKITVKIPSLYSSTKYPVHILKHNMGQAKPTKKNKLHTKLPTRHDFMSNALRKPSILVLAKAEARTLARRSGMREVAGFNYAAKMNPYAWPYPCPRPYFKTSWRYRLTRIKSLAGVGMQLRIFWAVIRWDDMATKPPAGGTNTITTDTEVTKKEVLKRRDTGEDGLRAEYLVQKIVIPINVPTPKKEKHVSIRSGLRTRKREDSPEPRDPSLTECWVPEEALELWEIRQFADKVNKVVSSNPVSPLPKESSSAAAVNRPSPASTPPVIAVTSATSVVPKSQSPEITKVQLEMQLRQQRAAMQLKRLNEKDPKKKGEAVNVVAVNQTQEVRPLVVKAGAAQMPQVIRTADGKTIVIHNATPAMPPASTTTVIRAVTPQGAIINLPASLVSGASQSPSQTIKIVQSPANLGGKRRLVTAPGVNQDIAAAQPQIIRIATQPKPPINVLAPTSATTAAGSTVPHIVTVNADGNIQRIIQQPPQQQPQPTPQFQIVRTPSGANQLILPSPAAPTPNVSAPTQLSLRHAAPQPSILPQAIRLPNGSMAIRITNPNIRPCLVTSAAAPAPAVVATPAPAAAVRSQMPQIVPQLQPQPQIQSAPQLTAIPKTDPPQVPQIQLIQGPNGQLTVRGLQPGQQLIKLSDGRLVLTTNPNVKPLIPSSSAISSVPPQESSPSLAVMSPTTPTPVSTPSLQAPAAAAVAAVSSISTTTATPTLSARPSGTQSPLRVVGKLPGSTMTFTTTLEPSLLSQSTFKSAEPPSSISSTSTAPEEKVQKPPDPPPPEPPNEGNEQQLPAATGETSTDADNETVATSSPPTVTAQMAQEVIKQALLNQNLAPSIHSKLVAFQKKQQEKREKLTSPSPAPPPPPSSESPPALAHSISVAAETKREEKPSPFPSESSASSVAQPSSVPSKKISEDAPPRWTDDEQRLASVTMVLRALVDRVEREEVREERRLAKERAAEERRRLAAAQRAAATLARHKEALKREILRKRAALEKELDRQAHEEVALELREFLNRSAIVVPDRPKLPTSPLKIDPELPLAPDPSPAKPMEVKSPDSSAKPPQQSQRSQGKSEPSGAPPRKRKNSGRSSGGDGKKSRMLSTGPPKTSKRLYCVCKTPYDETKFYIGCDVCSDWFHGGCIGITESQAESMGEYVCDKCKPKDREELFCFCRTPYDNSLFYIGCDRCEDWFHGTCVNVTEQEANKIDVYVCPRCLKAELSQQLNRDSRMQTLVLGANEYHDLKKLVLNLKNHKMAWPFLQSTADDGDHVDLTTLEHHLSARRYPNLASFFSEASLIFSSARRRFSPASPHARCAALLEPVLIAGIAAILKKAPTARAR